MKLRNITLFFFFLCLSILVQGKNPVRIGIAGLSHSHVDLLLRNLSRTDIQIVGIAESDRDMAERYAKRYGYDMNIVYNSIEEMIEKTKPEGVLAFTSIYDHLKVVEACAPKGIHVMVEKPLAVNYEHATKMAQLSKQYNTLVLTNYETSWYATNQKAYDLTIDKQAIGDIRKVVICDGHRGPKEIGVNKEFLEWLADPVQNGGGAVIDFGCYGVNLMTWLMGNQEPVSVSAVLQQIKPEIYPKVDDEATIVLSYPKAQAIIQASWNWPVDRKDMEIYGVTGYVKALNPTDFEYQFSRTTPKVEEKLPSLAAPYNEPFSYFAAAVRGEIKVSEKDLASLKNNLLVVKILDAARESAKTQKNVLLSTY